MVSMQPSPWSAEWSADSRPPVAIVPLAMALLAIGPFTAGMDVVAADRDTFRPLAQGVIVEIAPDDSTAGLASRVNVPPLFRDVPVRDWAPESSPRDRTVLGQFEASGDGESRGVPVQREIWCLAFAFKPPRFIDVDLPVDGLKMARRRVWYLVYRVRNEGALRLDIDAGDASNRSPKRIERPIRFLPFFVLETRQPLTEAEGLAAYRSYADRSVPAALAEIERRERVGLPLFDTAAMASEEIEPGGERWGVAIWENVHPDIRFFSVVATGLTNRFRFRPPGEAGGTGSVALESLRLDFWHRGDESDPDDVEIGLGYAGLFDRSMLGSRILESIGRIDRSQASPDAGFAAVGLTWEKVLEPSLSEAEALERTRPVSLAPLATVIDAVMRLESPAARARTVRDLFGDGGGEAFAELAAGVAAPAEAGGADARKAALRAIGVSEDAFDEEPLEGLGKVVRGLDGIPESAAREAAVKGVFGPAAPRFTELVRGLAAARCAAVLDEIGIDRSVVSTLGSRQAFDRVRQRIEETRGPDGGPIAGEARDRILAGIFGAEGPLIFADATRRHEGIDHEWVFRYETGEE